MYVYRYILIGMEKITPLKQPQKSEELTIETPEQAEARIQASESSEVAPETIEAKLPGVDDSVDQKQAASLTASQELLQLKRERYHYIQGENADDVQVIAEVENIAFDLAKERGINIDFSKLENMPMLTLNGQIMIPTLDGTALIFPSNSDEVVATRLKDKGPGVISFIPGGEEGWQLSQAEALEAREKYQPERLAQLLRDAQEIYKRRNAFKKPTPQKES